MKPISENEIELSVLELLKEIGYSVLAGPDISQDGLFAERQNYSDVILLKRLQDAVDSINPDIPAEAREEAVKKVLRHTSPNIITSNYNFHKLLVDGVDVEYRVNDRIKGDKVWLVDFNNPENNDWLAVNQFTIVENNINRRPDIILFINGLPLVLFELKNAADENATIWSAFNQVKTYQHQITSLFTYNAFNIISDGLEARAGTITSDKSRYMPWKTIDGETVSANVIPQIEVLVRGMLNKTVLLDLIRNFIVFEKDKAETIKKIAAYHQYHAVNKAIDSTKTAVAPAGDKRVGVIWHTQGSGKSLSMVFYAGKLIQALDNPTIVVLTDRNDLDDQLFGTFSKCQDLLRQTPVQAENRPHLRELLKVASGGVVFTTIHKFFPDKEEVKYPLLSDRKNIIVIADEAHRSQYDFIDGYARHMRDALPNASFIGFTGTPIETTDKNTIAVFGDHIDVYDIEQSVNDGATVRIYYESRLAKLELDENEKPLIDPEFEEVTEGEEVEKKEKLKSRWARLEAIVGSEKRIKAIAKDIVDHFEKRLQVMDGKGMIVGMSRRICVDLYKEITALRPDWHNTDDEKGSLKVIMTGSASDPLDWQDHIRNKARREELANRFKDPADGFKLVIVRDMWLTGFDAPSLHTMYIDKPMRSHGLMQAIARVNRVFRDKPGGLIVDYLGIADDLKQALAQYTESGGKGQPTFNQDDAVSLLLEKYEVVTNMFHGYDYKKIFKADAKSKMTIILESAEFILAQDEGKERFLKYVTEMSKAFALSVPDKRALAIQDEVGFFQSVRSAIVKSSGPDGSPRDEEQIESAIKQIVSNAIVADKVIDIFDAAGLKKPDISILSDEFLLEVKNLPQKHVAFELLKKLLNDEIKYRARKNLVQSRSFAALLEEAIRKYKNKALEVAELINHLIELAKEMNQAAKRGDEKNLTEDELAFYDALEVNDSAVKVLGDENLRIIARELLKAIRGNVSIDWTVRENVKAKLRVMVKRILRKYGYPPDKQEKATQTVLEQAELLAKDWAE